MFKKIAICASTLLLCEIFAVSAFASSSSSTKLEPVSSLAQLDVVLAKSIKLEKIPANLVPSISQLASNVGGIQGASYLHKSCDPYFYNSEANNPVPCWYGSSSAKRVVVIFGDSFVGNWIPALDIAGNALGFRVAEFSFSGCGTPFWNAKAGPGFDEKEVKACDSFHKNLPTSVNRLDPIAVIAASGSLSWGTTGGNSTYISALDTAFNNMSTPTNHPARIVLGTGPHFTEAAPSCLAVHPTAIKRCNFTYSRGSDFSVTLSRDQASVQGAKVTLIPTNQWICFRDTCPAVIGHIDVYADSDHLTIAISEYFSVLLEKALTSIFASAIS